MPESSETEIKWAEYPGRKCREPITEDGLIDHFCDLPEFHPGPPAARSSAASIERRQAWEAAHPGWESLVSHDDPFADLTAKLKEK